MKAPHLRLWGGHLALFNTDTPCRHRSIHVGSQLKERLAILLDRREPSGQAEIASRFAPGQHFAVREQLGCFPLCAWERVPLSDGIDIGASLISASRFGRTRMAFQRCNTDLPAVSAAPAS